MSGEGDAEKESWEPQGCETMLPEVLLPTALTEACNTTGLLGTAEASLNGYYTINTQ